MSPTRSWRLIIFLYYSIQSADIFTEEDFLHFHKRQQYLGSFPYFRSLVLLVWFSVLSVSVWSGCAGDTTPGRCRELLFLLLFRRQCVELTSLVLLTFGSVLQRIVQSRRLFFWMLFNQVFILFNMDRTIQSIYCILDEFSLSFSRDYSSSCKFFICFKCSFIIILAVEFLYYPVLFLILKPFNSLSIFLVLTAFFIISKNQHFISVFACYLSVPNFTDFLMFSIFFFLLALVVFSSSFLRWMLRLLT